VGPLAWCSRPRSSAASLEGALAAQELAEIVERALGSPPVRREPIHRGFTGNRRFILELADGRAVFVKWAYDEDSAEWLRKEHRLYRELAAPYMPRLLGWDDDGDHPLLALEALVDVHWPPPWSPADVAAVTEALDQVAATLPPADLPRAEEMVDPVGDWEAVRDDSHRFLSTGLASREWLDASWETLHAAAARTPVHGDALLHLDVRSDNLCIARGRALLFDWNWACLGNPDADLACWAPSLLLEGGPSIWESLPRAGEWAAWLAGIWAARAGLPPPPGAAPSLREGQRRQLGVALDVAARELGLPPPTLHA
jgi:hypothetical protein